MTDRNDLELTPEQAAGAVREGAVLLDVREPAELAAASVEGAVHIPMGDVKTRINELDIEEDHPIAVLCHHGQRSLMVTLYLREQGFENARSVQGGIDLWSQTVDPSIPRY